MFIKIRCIYCNKPLDNIEVMLGASSHAKCAEKRFGVNKVNKKIERHENNCKTKKEK